MSLCEKQSDLFVTVQYDILSILQRPLTTGILLKVAGKIFWLDFKYERLSYYCYSCGILGHYTTACQTFPYDETKLDDTRFLFGSWLRAEAREYSPFWCTFYDSEIILETPQSSSAIIPVLDPVPAIPATSVKPSIHVVPVFRYARLHLY